MKTSKIILSAVAILFGVMAATSCNQKENGPETVEAGQKITGISFKYASPDRNILDVTKASPDVEGAVASLTFYFFDASKPASTPFVFVPTGIEELSKDLTTGEFQYSAKITKEQLDEEPNFTSGDYYFYAIANEAASFCSIDVNALKTMNRADFEAYCVFKNNIDTEILGTSVLMTGRYGDDGTVTLEKGENILTKKIHLRRLVAKVHMEFRNGSNTDTQNVNFTPKSYQIHNYSRSSTLFERQGWKIAKSGSTDNVSGTYLAAGYKSQDVDGAIVDLPVWQYGRSIDFYMLENVQNTDPDAQPASWTYAERERRLYSEAEPYGPFKYAPENSTYVTVVGDYKDSKYTGEVQYTIHLGDFSAASGALDNFTVRRNFTYNFTVTVNGVDNIKIEAETGTENQPGAEGNIVASANGFTQVVDSHFETVLIKLPKPEGTSIDSYSINISTPYDDISQSKLYPDSPAVTPVQYSDYKWVEFGRPATATTFRAYNPEQVVDVYGLINELTQPNSITVGNHDHYIVDANYIYITAYINEFYYESDNWIFGNPAHTHNISKFINVPNNRTMTVALAEAKVSPDGHSSFAEGRLFQLSQRSIKTVSTLVDNSYRALGIESVEENGNLLAIARNADARDDNNGRYNTLLELGVGSNWSTYLNVSKNGYIENKIAGTFVPGTANAAELLTVMASSAQNRANYACISRNRDLNGDGKIDIDEVKWYLPSGNQTRTLWSGAASLSDELVFNTKNTDGGGAQYVTSSGGRQQVWWAEEGAAYGTVGANRPYSFRCIRTINDDFSSDITSVAEVLANCGTNMSDELQNFTDAQGNKIMVIRSVGLSEGDAVRTSVHEGEYAPHMVNAAQDKLPQYLQISKANLTQPAKGMTITKTVNGTTTTFGNGTQALTGNSFRYYSSTVDRGTTTTYQITFDGVAPDAIYVKARRSNTGNGYGFTFETTGLSGTLTATTNNDNNNSTLLNYTKLNVTSNTVTIVAKAGSSNGGYTMYFMIPNDGRTRYTWAEVSGTDASASTDKTDIVGVTGPFNGSKICERYYSEEPSKADLGKWRVPNEREFNILCKYLYQAKPAGYDHYAALETSTVERTQYWRWWESGAAIENNIFKWNGSNIENNNANGTTAMSPRNVNPYGYVRCVRDYVPGNTDL